MRRASLYILSVFAAVLLAFGCGGVGTSSVTDTFSPTDGSTDAALNVTVTATFSGAITDPADWTVVLTLKKNNAGDSLCTDVTYEYANLVATCIHDDLENGTSYTLTVSGLKDAEGKTIGEATATFATIGLPTASLKLVRLDSTELDLSSTAIPRAVTIKVTFSRAPDASERTDIESGFVLEQGGTALGKTFAWSTDFTELTVTPDRWFEYGTAYTVDISGALATDVSETFTTALWGDTNGDGYSDVFVGADNADGGGTDRGRAYVFLGAAPRVSDCDMSDTCLPDTMITGAADNEYLGFSVSIAGDVNADGYADIIVGAYNAAGTKGEAYVLHGSASGIADCDLSAVSPCTPDATITGTAAGDELGKSVSHAGDVNGDGYDDIIVGAPQQAASQGYAYVFHGSQSGIGASPSATLGGEVADDRFGHAVSAAGDVNGDGYDDVIAGAWNWGGAKGRAYVYQGSAVGIGTSPTATITGAAASDELGFHLSGAGDVNGDGYGDIIVPAYNAAGTNGQAYVFNGSAGGISDCDLPGCADATITGENGSDNLGKSVAGAGDVNGDGYDDIIVGATNAASNGQAYVLNGSGSGILECDLSAVTPCIPDATITGAAVNDYLGYSGVGVADVNGDGYDDVILGAYGAATGDKGQAYVINGSASGISDRNLATQSDTTLTGANDADEFGIIQQFD